MKRTLYFSIAAFCAICLAFAGVSYSHSVNTVSAQEPVGTPVAQLTVSDPQTAILHSVYALANPSVVSITVRIPAQQTSIQQASQYEYAAGSGFVYDTQNHIVTNTHVIENADQIEVAFSDGTQRHATLVGSDPDSDIAVIKVDGDMSAYKPLAIAESDAVQVGDMAIAIGNPFRRAGTMTHGIVSGVHRTVAGLTQSQNGGGYTIPDAIQTDAPINPGNSGGPLLNAAGQVIGVNEQIESNVQQSSGVGFAIPSDLVKAAADTLISTGKAEHSWLGIAGVSLSLDLNDALKLDESQRGVYVTAVSSGSPAAQAGLVVGQRQVSVQEGDILAGSDVITAIDGKAVNDFDGLTAYLFEHTKPGQTVMLTVLRNGKQENVQVTLQARPHTS